MKKILGLDLGTNSIGWALVESDFDNKTGKIIGLGSRIIPKSMEELSKYETGQSVSQTAERTSSRGVRRLRERQLLRRERLHRVLNILGYLPEHYANQIDFEIHPGKFFKNTEPKLAYKLNGKGEFIFQDSFHEMLNDFKRYQPELLVKNDGSPAKIPYDWTIYYLRKKALSEKINKEELAWIILNFNQKRGYYQLRDEMEAEPEDSNKTVEYHSLKVTNVIEEGKNSKGQIIYKIKLENGWEDKKTSSTPIDWIGKTKDFIVTTTIAKNGEIKRNFRAPSEDDWILIKKKTENELILSNKTVGAFIYDKLLQNPSQKIRGKLISTIERNFYKEELKRILQKQAEYHPEFSDKKLLMQCIEDLYEFNEEHKNFLSGKDLIHLIMEDIIFYQRPLKSKKALISNCRYEKRFYKTDNAIKEVPVKCIAKSYPLYQEFRLWQFVHNLKIYERLKEVNGKLHADFDVTDEYLNGEEKYVHLFDFLNSKTEINQKTFLRFFKLSSEKFRWNFADIDTKSYPCNETRGKILARLNKVIDHAEEFLTKEREVHLWHILYSIEDKSQLEKSLMKYADKNELDAKSFVKHFISFPRFEKDYGSFSAKALQKILPLMRMGKYWDEDSIIQEAKERITAIAERLQSIDYEEKRIEEVADDYLPKQILKSFIACKNFYSGLNTFQACYAIYGKHSEALDTTKWRSPDDIDDFLHEFKQHSLRNPIVEQVITETLRVVRDIWKFYGNSQENFFDEIHLELGREMKLPAEERAEMTKKIQENENTNLRIKALLTELAHDGTTENVRPQSPSQQEILKIYEDGVLKSNVEIPDDILKISKTPQPSREELFKYKLWLEQKYRSPYTGNIIPLSKLFTPEYEIEHIIPQSRYYDDSLSNKVICEAEVNKDKDKDTAYEYIKNNSGKKIELTHGKTVTLFTIKDYEKFVQQHYSNNKAKKNKLLMEDIPEKFIERQLNDTRYISKYVKNILSNIVREEGEKETTSKNIAVCSGSITDRLKEDWGLKDIWNELLAPRFERLNILTQSNRFGSRVNKDGKQFFQISIPAELQKGFSKKRLDHRHHALDALTIACATRNHINLLNNEHAKSDNIRYDLRRKLCRIEKQQIHRIADGIAETKTIEVAREFIKPWPDFVQEARNELEKIIVSYKQNLRVINKTVNYYQKWVKNEKGELKKVYVKQEKGDHWAIRKPLHAETYYGKINLKRVKQVRLSEAINQYEMIVDKSLRKQIKALMHQNLDKNQIIKFFKDLGNTWDNKSVERVDIYYFDDNNSAVRIKIDHTFTSKFILDKISDTGIQKILLNHLHRYDETDSNGKVTEHPEIAFSPDGIDKMNKNIKELNDGKNHKPIYFVRKYETLGNKFPLGQGMKSNKFVEAAKGTNLFFAVYTDESGKRYFETIPLNMAIENLKNGHASVPEFDLEGRKLKFYLSPYDLVYVPENSEIETIDAFNTNVNNDRIYKFISSTGRSGFFVKQEVASVIFDKFEFSPLNKAEKSIDNQMIKDVCWKLEVDRIGRITRIIR